MRFLALILLLLMFSVANSACLTVQATRYHLIDSNGIVGGGLIFDNPVDNGSCFSLFSGGVWCE